MRVEGREEEERVGGGVRGGVRVEGREEEEELGEGGG